MESSTQILRRLLDERGVEWWNETDPKPQGVTMAHVDEQLIEYHENVNGSIGYHVYNMHDLTPDQAIDATLGRGECRLERVNSGPMYDVWRCPVCGYKHAESVSGEVVTQNYCPRCGRRVVYAVGA